MDTNKLITNARNFLTERVQSLEKDVRYCIVRNENTPDWPAPFPALLYCFSTIDLLGSLYGGDAKSSSKISERSLNYMTDIMSYPKDKAKLIQKIFRHKLVHLAQPMPSQKIRGIKYRWKYYHDNLSQHLKLDNIGDNNTEQLSISIVTLADDISTSVFKPNGYLQRLEKDPDLQRNFETAYKQIIED